MMTAEQHFRWRDVMVEHYVRSMHSNGIARLSYAATKMNLEFTDMIYGNERTLTLISRHRTPRHLHVQFAKDNPLTLAAQAHLWHLWRDEIIGQGQETTTDLLCFNILGHCHMMPGTHLPTDRLLTLLEDDHA